MVFRSVAFFMRLRLLTVYLPRCVAFISPRLATRCIQSDPYGVLKYGEPDHLPLHQARLLLNSLASLANEDPYFRSEDWGKRAITGLARSELKDDIVALIKNPDRHVHLSTLVLEALDGSQLVDVIAPELSAIVENTSAAYVERVHAAEALIGSDVDVNWPAVVASLQTKKSLADRRLALEIIALARGVGFAASQMADAILSYKRLPRRPVEVSVTINAAGDDDDEPYVSGMVYGITRKISPTQSGEILDEIVTHIQRLEKPAYWRPGYELSSSIQQLLEKAIEQDSVPSAGRVWSWLRLTKGEQGHSSKRNHPIRDWLMQNPQLRREIQKIAFSEGSSDGGPWMAIVHDLPTVNPGLALTVTDITELLNEVGSKDEIGNFGIELWSALVQSQQSAGGMPEEIRNAADIGRQRHSVLDQQWRNIIAPPKRDWRKEEQERKTDREQKRTRKFGRHRASFLPIKHKIASGEEIGALKQIANAYLGRYSDLNDEAEPDARVREWLGDELTGAALEGFVSALLRTDMPSARQIAETHAEGKEWNVEA